jgi:chemotaxis response regulator CheB
VTCVVDIAAPLSLITPAEMMRREQLDCPQHSAIIRKALCETFEREEDLDVCGEAENGRAAIEKAQRLRPDLIVLDLSMPVMNGLDAAHVLKRLMPKPKFRTVVM